jgi:hypothetical protein
MEMEGGSTATVDFSGKLRTAKFAELADEAFLKAPRQTAIMSSGVVGGYV